jgi:hypothetical protein
MPWSRRCRWRCCRRRCWSRLSSAGRGPRQIVVAAAVHVIEKARHLVAILVARLGHVGSSSGALSLCWPAGALMRHSRH